MQLLPASLFTIGLLFLPESPRFLAYQQIRDERLRIQQGLAVRSRFPADHLDSPLSLKDAEDSATPPSAPGGTSGDATSYLDAQPSPGLPDSRKTTFTKLREHHRAGSSGLLSTLAYGASSSSSQQQRRDDDDPPIAISTLAYLRNLPVSSPPVKAEMAEIFAQLDEIEEERTRRQGRTTAWKALLAKPSNRRRLAIGGFMGAWQIWTGQNAILYYA